MVSFLLLFLVSPIEILATEVRHDLVGTWEGSIKLPTQELGIIIEFKVKEGLLIGDIDIPLQGLKDIPLKEIKLNDQKVEFAISEINGNPQFIGEFSSTEEVRGSFFQFAQSFPFELKRAEETQELNTANNNFREEEVSIAVAGGGLAGTLTIPKDLQDLDKAVILVAGSGPTDRDGSSAALPIKIDTLKQIAEYLSSQGIRTLRYDKRGIGASKGFDLNSMTFAAFKDDLLEVIDYVQDSLDLDSEDIYLLGHFSFNGGKGDRRLRRSSAFSRACNKLS